MPSLELLWTDVLLWLVVCLAVVAAWRGARRRHLREAWTRVLQCRRGVFAALVLLVYLLIALLDSVHFRPAPSSAPPVAQRTQSLLDWVLSPMRGRLERTYSAPFAAYQLSTEFSEGPDGPVSQRPRLRYGGAHLQDPARERGADLLRICALALAQALLCWLLLVVAVLWWSARYAGRGFRAQLRLVTGLGSRAPPGALPAVPTFPWYTFFLTLGVLLALGFCVAHLGVHYHLLGTSKVGTDVFYQAMKSVRTGVVIGVLAIVCMVPIAALLGISAGYFRGRVDDLVQYLYTTVSAVPWVLLVAAAALILQGYMDTHAIDFNNREVRADARLLMLCLILGLTGWVGLCRLLRGESLKLSQIEYVQSARAFGVSHARILLRHILPNCMHIILIVVVLDFSGLVLAEAVLSYIGIGVDPSTQSWGNMINAARLELAREPTVWWSLLAAFLFMLGLVLSFNLFADAVRDAFDPRLKGGRLG